MITLTRQKGVVSQVEFNRRGFRCKIHSFDVFALTASQVCGILLKAVEGSQRSTKYDTAIAGMRDGSSVAWQEYASTLGPKFYRLLRKLTQDSETIEDRLMDISTAILTTAFLTPENTSYTQVLHSQFKVIFLKLTPNDAVDEDFTKELIFLFIKAMA